MGKSKYNKEYQKEYRENNKEHIRELKKKWWGRTYIRKTEKLESPVTEKERKHRDVIWTQKWQQKNPGYVAFQTAKRRARKLKATPKWADLEEIKEIYLNCPKDFHVDHIIPLQGKYVTGLHIPENLQYLSATENHRKSNHYKEI